MEISSFVNGDRKVEMVPKRKKDLQKASKIKGFRGWRFEFDSNLTQLFIWIMYIRLIVQKTMGLFLFNRKVLRTY